VSIRFRLRNENTIAASATLSGRETRCTKMATR